MLKKEFILIDVLRSILNRGKVKMRIKHKIKLKQILEFEGGLYKIWKVEGVIMCWSWAEFITELEPYRLDLIGLMELEI